MAERKGYFHSYSIGGTDAGAIIGINNYKTALDVWKRLVQPEGYVDQPDSAVMEQGRILEPIIIDKYMATTRRQVEPAEFMNHDLHPFLHARPDGAITSGVRAAMDGPGILEVKSFGMYNFKKTKEEGIDPSYYAQIQHYLFVTGFKWGSFAIFGREAWELYWFDVERDEEFIARMVDACVTFWNNYVVTKTPPPLDAQISAVRPRENIGAESVIHHEAEWVNAFRQYKTANDTYKLSEHSRKLAAQTIKDLMGDVESVVVPQVGKVSWKESTRSSLDVDLLRQDYPTIDMTKYTKLTATRTFLPTIK